MEYDTKSLNLRAIRLNIFDYHYEEGSESIDNSNINNRSNFSKRKIIAQIDNIKPEVFLSSV